MSTWSTISSCWPSSIGNDRCGSSRSIWPSWSGVRGLGRGLRAPAPGGRRCSRTMVVDADGQRMRQVVDNLLVNALIHTPVGTAVRISVSGGGRWAVLTVQDEGRASIPLWPPGSSSRSSAPTRHGHGPPGVPGWAWPSWRPLSRPMAGQSGWSRLPVGGRPSRFGSPWSGLRTRTVGGARGRRRTGAANL